MPSFKGALHQGKVVVGEIGIKKKEIVFSGDILNTISRMMEQCKLHNQKFIISRDILDIASKSNNDRYNLESLGEMSYLEI